MKGILKTTMAPYQSLLEVSYFNGVSRRRKASTIASTCSDLCQAIYPSTSIESNPATNTYTVEKRSFYLARRNSIAFCVIEKENAIAIYYL